MKVTIFEVKRNQLKKPLKQEVFGIDGWVFQKNHESPSRNKKVMDGHFTECTCYDVTPGTYIEVRDQIVPFKAKKEGYNSKL